SRIETPFRQGLLLRERHAHWPDPIHNGRLSTGVAPLPLSPARQFCRDVPRLWHFVLRVPIAFPNAPHRRWAMFHPRGFALVSVPRRRMTRVLPICSPPIDLHPTPPSPERKA